MSDLAPSDRTPHDGLVGFGAMRDSRPARWSPLGGIVFVGLWIAAFGLNLVEEPGTTDADVVSHYTDSGNQGRAQMSSTARSSCSPTSWSWTCTCQS